MYMELILLKLREGVFCRFNIKIIFFRDQTNTFQTLFSTTLFPQCNHRLLTSRLQFCSLLKLPTAAASSAAPFFLFVQLEQQEKQQSLPWLNVFYCGFPRHSYIPTTQQTRHPGVLGIAFSPFTPAFDMAFCIERRSTGTNNTRRANNHKGCQRMPKQQPSVRLFAQKMPQGLLNRCLALSSLYAVVSYFLAFVFLLSLFSLRPAACGLSNLRISVGHLSDFWWVLCGHFLQTTQSLFAEWK